MRARLHDRRFLLAFHPSSGEPIQGEHAVTFVTFQLSDSALATLEMADIAAQWNREGVS